MTVPSQPEGYTTVSPYLIVDGAARTIDLLVRVLGGVEIRRFLDDSDKIKHAEVRMGDGIIVLADGVEG